MHGRFNSISKKTSRYAMNISDNMKRVVTAVGISESPYAKIFLPENVAGKKKGENHIPLLPRIDTLVCLIGVTP